MNKIYKFKMIIILLLLSISLTSCALKSNDLVIEDSSNNNGTSDITQSLDALDGEVLDNEVMIDSIEDKNLELNKILEQEKLSPLILAENPSNIIEVSPNVYSYFNDSAHASYALEQRILDLNKETPKWETYYHWSLEEIGNSPIPGLSTLDFNWIKPYYKEKSDVKDVVINPDMISFVDQNTIYFRLVQKIINSDNTKEEEFVYSIHRGTAFGSWPYQIWTLESIPVFVTDNLNQDERLGSIDDFQVFTGEGDSLYMTINNTLLIELDEINGRVFGNTNKEIGKYNINSNIQWNLLDFASNSTISYINEIYYVLTYDNILNRVYIGSAKTPYGPFLDNHDVILDNEHYSSKELVGIELNLFLNKGSNIINSIKNINVFQDSQDKLGLSYTFNLKDNDLDYIGFQALLLDENLKSLAIASKESFQYEVKEIEIIDKEESTYDIDKNFILDLPHTVQILPLGDSITIGTPYSYRMELSKILTKTGLNFDFVGSLSTEIPGFDQNWDIDHEGHGGLNTKQINNGLDSWLEGYTPDIALIHLGTNDMLYIIKKYSTIEDSVEEMKSIIRKLRKDNPNVTILLAHILPFGKSFKKDTSDYNFLVGKWNHELTTIAFSMTSEKSEIRIVDMNAFFNDNDLADGIHPNVNGAAKMAEAWAEVLFYK